MKENRREERRGEERREEEKRNIMEEEFPGLEVWLYKAWQKMGSDMASECYCQLKSRI